MKLSAGRKFGFPMICLAVLAGCVSQEQTSLELPHTQDAKTAHAEYWLAKPAAASVFGTDYDQLWNVCEDLARRDLFLLDRQDYRDGLLTTKPLVSRQFFEPWRPDTGDGYGVLQNSLQTIRRTIYFEFQKLPGGYVVTPKVVVERSASPTKHITSSSQYAFIFAYQPPSANEIASGAPAAGYFWYAIGRDLAMEAQMATAIKEKIGQ
jgi:hypothetical protein